MSATIGGFPPRYPAGVTEFYHICGGGCNLADLSCSSLNTYVLRLLKIQETANSYWGLGSALYRLMCKL